MEYRSKIDKIVRRIPDAVDRGARQTANVVADLAKTYAPRRTGVLRSSINVRKEKEGTYTVVAGNEVAFYSAFQEYGTVHHEAQPYLRPAMFVAAEVSEHEIAAELWGIDGVERAP